MSDILEVRKELVLTNLKPTLMSRNEGTSRPDVPKKAESIFKLEWVRFRKPHSFATKF